MTYSGELTEPVTLTHAAAFLHLRRQEVKFEYTELEESSVDVTLQVYKMATLPVDVSFINAPRTLILGAGISLSKKTLKVAGPESKIDRCPRCPWAPSTFHLYAEQGLRAAH